MIKFPRKIYVYYDEPIEKGDEDDTILVAERTVDFLPGSDNRSEEVAVYVLQEIGTVETTAKFKKAK